MRRFILSPRALVALGLVLGLAVTSRGDDDMARTQVLELNKITGSDSFRAKVQELKANPELAKKMVKAGLLLAKEKDRLKYNAALILGQTAAELKDLKAGEVYYRLCADQGVKLFSTKKLLDSYGGLIDLYYEAKKFDQSARVCQELLELKMDDVKGRIFYVPQVSPFGRIDYVEADSFDAARPLHSGVHRLLIQAMAKQGKFDQALKLVDNLIKDKDHWQHHQLKAQVLTEAGKYALAAKTYENVIDKITKDKNLEAEDKDYYLYRNRSLLSNLYVDMKQIDKATEQMEALMQKKPEDPGVHNDLGYILADNGMKLDYAEKLIRKALDLDRKRRADLKKENPDIEDRDNGAYLDSLGWVLFKQKKFKEAKDALLQAVEDKRTQHIEIYDHLGDVFLELGDQKEALSAWRKGLEFVGEGRRDLERKAVVEKKIAKHSK